MTTEKQPRKRRTNSQREDCIDYAHSLLEINVPPYVVAQRLQRKYQLTRATAWRDVQTANDKRGSEGIRKQPDILELRDSIVNLIYQSAVEAADESDFSSLAKLSKEVRELAKLGGFEFRSSIRDDPALTACRDIIGRD